MCDRVVAFHSAMKVGATGFMSPGRAVGRLARRALHDLELPATAVEVFEGEI